MSEPVAVHIDACPCPGAPHPDGDDVYLRPRLGLKEGIAVQKLVIDARREQERLDAAEATGVVAEGYLLYGVIGWTFVDADGAALPVNRQTITERLLDDFTVGEKVADVADDLYMAAVLLPLLRQVPSFSPAGPTNGSTSRASTSAKATGRSRSTRRSSSSPKRSTPSSTTTTQTGATVMTSLSLAGASSS